MSRPTRYSFVPMTLSSDELCSVDMAPIKCLNGSLRHICLLQVILKGLVTWITNVGSGSQLIRTNLYAALVAYLRIGKTVRAEPGRRATELSDRGRLARVNMEVVQSVGPGFIEILARDACAGHEVCLC